jgi:hypothetical protein
MTMKTPAPRTIHKDEPAGADLKTAYQIHTLVQLLTARLAGTPGWAPRLQAPYPPMLH